MKNKKQPTLPTIHLNGTSQSMLVKGYKDVSKALKDTHNKISWIDMHERDYYVRPGAWEQAKNEYYDAIKKLNDVKAYFDNMLIGIAAGGHK
jgi:uncharacterized protein YydD (DUF2326 family)